MAATTAKGWLLKIQRTAGGRSAGSKDGRDNEEWWKYRKGREPSLQKVEGGGQQTAVPGR
jgi:hypothetical protein